MSNGLRPNSAPASTASLWLTCSHHISEPRYPGSTSSSTTIPNSSTTRLKYGMSALTTAQRQRFSSNTCCALATTWGRAWQQPCCTESRAIRSFWGDTPTSGTSKPFSYVYPLANQNLLRRIERPELPPASIDALGRALKTRQITDKVAFVNLGRVEREDLIPQIADFCLQFEGIEWAVVSGIFETDLVVSVRNVGYVKAAGKVLKDAFGHLGSAGGHGSMAKAILPLSILRSKWKTNARNTRLINEKLRRHFLKSLLNSNK